MAYVRYQGQNNVYDTSTGKIVTYEQANAQNLFQPGKIQDVATPNPYAQPITAESFGGKNLTAYEKSQITGGSGGAITPEGLNNKPEFELTPTPYETEASELIKLTRGLYDQLVGKSAYQTEQEQKYNIPGITNTLNDLTSQLQGIANEAAAIPVEEQSRAASGTVLTAGLQADQNQRLRDNAVKALGVSTLLAAAKGQLATAQNLADRAVAAKYDPIIEQINANKANLDLILADPMATLAEKNRAQAQKEAQDKKAAEAEAEKEQAKNIWSIATKAAGNGENFVASSEYPSLSQALTAISEAPTAEEALQIAASVNITQGKATGAGTGITRLSTEKKTRLLGAGFTDADIDNIENDINNYGIDQVLADPNLTSTQKRAIQGAYGSAEGTQFLNADYFRSIFTEPQLKKAAGDAGFTAGGFLGFGVGDEGVNDYLNYLEGLVAQYRTAGYSDQEILKMMQ